MKQEIKIMGAGPAGLTAAIILARAGHKVVVYERASQVGAGRKGDLEALENWTSAEDIWIKLSKWGIEKNFTSIPMHALTAFGPGFEDCGQIHDTVPMYYWSFRGPEPGSLDRGLLEQAQDHGVEVRFNRPIQVGEADIIAGGGRRPRMYALGYTFRTAAADGAYVCLDKTLAPKAYAYLVIVAGRATIATCSARSQRGMKEKLSQVIEGFQAKVQFDLCEPEYFAASIGYQYPPITQKDGKLFVGEAGGFQDILAGFGIRMGMTTACLAARSIIEGGSYEGLLKEHCLPMLRAAVVNRWGFEVMGNPGYRIITRYMSGYLERGRALLNLHYYPRWYTPLLWHLAKGIAQ
jgi:flavin-dependent dehydrogenase